MSIIRKLPIGVQDFEDLRTNGYLYVDKTAYIYHLATTGKPYFLGRPRRFGKSLLLSTLKAYFEGKKNLFEGLKIYEMEKDWTKYPVIYIDLSKDTYDSLDKLDNVLSDILSKYESLYKINNIDSSNSGRFYNLLQTVHELTGKRVVVLVDEYDKPLRDNFDNTEIYQSIHKPLLGFYSVFKSSDAHTHFYLLSGITKVPFDMLSGDLNQLYNISLHENYANLSRLVKG